MRAASPPNELCVLADRTRAALLICNLLTNALKHTPPGGWVSVSARAVEGRRVEVSVRDTGRGVPSEYRERIFDRFFRAPGGAEPGAGLGPAIAKEIVEAHGGRLWLASEEGPGAVFRVELKRAS